MEIQHPQQNQNKGIACLQCTHPPLIHPESVTAQLGLTTEEAEEVHRECICTQENLQVEMDWGDRIWHKQVTKQETHAHIQPYKHQVHNMMNDHNMHTMLFKHHKNLGGNFTSAYCLIKQLACKLDTPRETYGDWAEDMQWELECIMEGEYIKQDHPPLVNIMGMGTDILTH